VKTEVLVSLTSLKALTDQATNVLRRGDPVALPTETVYGLAAHALNPEAVAKIFEAKERPHFDPLIVHVPDLEWLEKVAELPAQDRQLILKLAETFWPGPFTIVLPKREIVPDLVTSGLDTVAVRISGHPVFSEIITAFGKPLAAPSANRFGRISPTTAQHVLDELGGRIPLIVDAGPTMHGIESTIVAVRDSKINILRRGPITEEELSEFGEIDIVTSPERIVAPGQLPSHYAPRTPLSLIDDANSFSNKGKQRIGLLAWNDVTSSERGFTAVRRLSERGDLRESAANLFRYLRELDALDLDLIVAERVPETGLGAAIMDRLRRAAHRRLDTLGKPGRSL
jgi:L-threonylcarbamoyladenylate synthase